MPCPGSNGATLEQLMIVNDLGTVFGLVLQNVFAISGILGMRRETNDDLGEQKMYSSQTFLFFQPTRWRYPS